MAKKSITFVGAPGEFHFGIPARDLSDDDLATLDDAQRALIAASPLYTAPPAPDAPKKDAAKKETK